MSVTLDPKVPPDVPKELMEELLELHRSALICDASPSVLTEACEKLKSTSKHKQGNHLIAVNKAINDRYFKVAKDKSTHLSSTQNIGYEAPLPKLHRAVEILSKYHGKDNKDVDRLYNIIQSAATNLDKQVTCSQEEVRDLAKNHTAVFLTSHSSVTVKNFSSENNEWTTVNGNAEVVLGPALDEFYSAILENIESGGPEEKGGLTGIDTEGYGLDLYGPKGCEKDLPYLRLHHGVIDSPGPTLYHWGAKGKSMSVTIPVDEIPFRVTVPDFVNPELGKHEVWGTWFQHKSDYVVPEILKEFIRGTTHPNFAFVTSGRDEDKFSIFRSFKVPIENFSSSPRLFIKAEAVLDSSFIDSNTKKNGVAFQGAFVLGCIIPKGSPATHPKQREYPNTANQIDRNLMIYQALDTIVPPNAIKAMLVHKFSLDYLANPESRDFLIENAKHWAVALQTHNDGLTRSRVLKPFGGDSYIPLVEALEKHIKIEKVDLKEVAGETVNTVALDLSKDSIKPFKRPLGFVNTKSKKPKKGVLRKKDLDWDMESYDLMQQTLDSNISVSQNVKDSTDIQKQFYYLADENQRVSNTMQDQFIDAMFVLGKSATGLQVLNFLGEGHIRGTTQFYEKFPLKETIVNVWSKLIKSAVRLVDPIEVIQPSENSVENLNEHEQETARLVNYLKSCFPNIDDLKDHAIELGHPLEDETLLKRNVESWKKIAQIFKENYSNVEDLKFATNAQTLIYRIFGEWPDGHFDQHKLFSRFLLSKCKEGDGPALEIVNEIVNPEGIGQNDVIIKIKQDQFCDYTANLETKYTNIEEGRIPGQSQKKKNLSSNTTVVFASKGFYQGSPSYDWINLKKLSGFKEFYKNLSIENGHPKRKYKVEREKIKTKKRFKIGTDNLAATPENFHYDRIRREDLIEFCHKWGLLRDEEEYESLTFLNQESDEVKKPKHSKITWKHFADLVKRCETLLFLYHYSAWTSHETYLEREATQSHYQQNGFSPSGCTYDSRLSADKINQIKANLGQLKKN